MNNNSTRSWYGDANGLTPAQQELFDKYVAESQEQIDIVLDDSKYILVRSSAGSGKSTVLLAKIIYLLKIKGVNPSEILYLSFNNKNVYKFQEKLKSLIVNPEEAQIMCRTFHSLALHIIELKKGIWPCILEPVYEATDKPKDNTGYAHNRAEVYLSSEQFIKKTKDVLKCPAFSQYVINSNRDINHRYVSYLVDKNGIPGSCRSDIEMKIFEYLVQHDVNFAYEEPNKEMKARPDFTIYADDNKTKYYYEHFGMDNGNYRKNEMLKKQTYEKRYGKLFFYTEGKVFQDITNKLEAFLKDPKNHIHFSDQIVNNGKDLSDKLFANTVEDYRRVRDTIVETDQDIQSVKKFIRNHGNSFQKSFMTKVFVPMENRYKKLLKDEQHVNTDFAECMKAAVDICNKASHKVKEGCTFKYVLVDEYQDISQARYKLLKAIMSLNPQAQLIAVGDGRQSIYSFDCADLRLFVDFKVLWGQEYSMIKDMSMTYRFGEPLMSISSGFINKANDCKSYFGETLCKKDMETKLFFVEGDNQYRCVKKAINKIKENDANKTVLVLLRFNTSINNFYKCFKPKSFDPDKDAITSLHKAKGLDADYVFIMDCNGDSYPYVRKDTSQFSVNDLLNTIREMNNKRIGEKDAILDEDRRLFYVALTRAKKAAFVFYEKDNKSGYVKELIDIYKKVEHKQPTIFSTTDDIIGRSQE